MLEALELREAYDAHLTLYLATVGARAELDNVTAEVSVTNHKISATENAAIARAKKVFDTAVEKIVTAKDEARSEETQKMAVAENKAKEAQDTETAFRNKMKEDHNVDLPVYSGAVGGGSTRL